MVEAVADRACPLAALFRGWSGSVLFVLMPDDWRLISRVLIGWDIGVAVYLALGIWTAIVTDTKHIRLRSVLFDEGRVLIPLLCVTAALASLGAIFFQLSTAPAGHRFVNLACRRNDTALMELHSIHLRLSLRPRVLCGTSWKGTRTHVSW